MGILGYQHQIGQTIIYHPRLARGQKIACGLGLGIHIAQHLPQVVVQLAGQPVALAQDSHGLVLLDLLRLGSLALGHIADNPFDSPQPAGGLIIHGPVVLFQPELPPALMDIPQHNRLVLQEGTPQVLQQRATIGMYCFHMQVRVGVARLCRIAGHAFDRGTDVFKPAPGSKPKPKDDVTRIFGQQAEARFAAAQLFAGMLQRKVVFNAGQHFFYLKGLGDIVYAARMEGRYLAFDFIYGADKNNGDVGSALVLFERSADFIPIHFWHTNI